MVSVPRSERSTQTTVDQAFYVAFERWLQRDRYLRSAVRSINLQSCSAGLALVIEPAPNRDGIIFRKSYRIAQFLMIVSDRFHQIKVNGTVLELRQLLQLHPVLIRLPEGSTDKKLSMEKYQRDAQRYRALLGFAAARASVFIISTDGFYRDAHLQINDDMGLSVESILNRSLSEVFSPEVSCRLLAEIRQTYYGKSPRKFTYVVEDCCDYQYQAEAFPILGASEVVLVVSRKVAQPS